MCIKFCLLEKRWPIFFLMKNFISYLSTYPIHPDIMMFSLQMTVLLKVSKSKSSSGYLNKHQSRAHRAGFRVGWGM